jgi:hypothetical protein
MPENQREIPLGSKRERGHWAEAENSTQPVAGMGFFIIQE